MNNLYIFAIGGSGERVMRSFIMLLAAGVKLGASKVVPIFVDNDAKSSALTRCRNLISYYNASGNKVGIGTLCQREEPKDRASFFQTVVEEPILLDIAGDTIGDLKSIIGKGLGMENPVQKDILEERDLLFSEDDLAMKLTVGFVGNPNIGSVVLNALSFTDDKFENVLKNAGPGDGVMVVGSLFGGTGAAGFPLIVNNFMRAEKNRPTIGGVAILPYFELGSAVPDAQAVIDTDKWDVDSDTFSTKTRAALMYYDDYMKAMDFLYYVGDDHRATYPHCVGGEKQDNPVHLVELLGAMSIVDFSKQKNQDNIVYKQPVWGIAEDATGGNTICNISSIKNKDIKHALVKFQLMREFFINNSEGFLKHGIQNDHAYAKDIAFTEVMRQSCVGTDPKKEYKDVNEMNNVVNTETSNFPYAWGLNAFFKEWMNWWSDLNGKTARRKFTIFPNEGVEIDQNNVTLKFYNEGDMGIASTELRREGPIWNRRTVEKPVYPNMATSILNAHKALKLKNIPEDKKLSTLLRSISDGLDTVIDSTCKL
ncbi:MAG: hypothetical protein K2H46_03460 [Muribaculaceae bacterium]|nr:hypothetical protein [Muribaculaceae bacterium]